MLMAPSNPIINRPVLPKRSHKRSPMYPNCTATTFPRQGHPKGRPPDHRTAANGIIERAGVIDQPRVSGKLRESDYNSEEKKSREQCVTPNDCKPDEQTIIDNIKSGACAPVRPRRERQQRNRDHIDDNRRDHHAQTTTLKRKVVRIRKRHDAALASHAITVNHVTGSGFVGRQRWTKRACLQSYGVISERSEESQIKFWIRAQR